MDLNHLRNHVWDFVIVGTGMGGSTLGYALARKGKSVLFCEKGKSFLSRDSSLRGNYAEKFFSSPDFPQPKHREILKSAGRCWEEVLDLSSVRSKRYIPFIGCGAGGSTAVYRPRLAPAGPRPEPGTAVVYIT